ncbi:MAG TPA: pyrroloquinoline quinone-dependent dehydrogenase, partial [Alphaproteobacteria bacterium]|nr:pyrroloquinoline quinone-dependent dehydrogenase [Alphaproteobacteria bacterium]
AAGGTGMADTAISDAFVAFALPGPGDEGPSLWSRTLGQPGGHFYAGLAGTLLIMIGAYFAWRRWRAGRRA